MAWENLFDIFTLLAGFWLLWRIPTPDEHGEVSAKVSVIIPARNEEKRIRRLLDSLTRQTLQPFEIIVVDDSSEDETKNIVRSYGLKVVDAGDLPDHWLGKPWACWQGARTAKGEIFVFLDADTYLSENGLQKIVTSYQKRDGALSIQPYHEVIKPYEQLSAIFNIIVMMGTNLFTPLGSKLKPRAFFGPCVVCNRVDYFAVGGHEAVSRSILEDIDLGRLFVRKNFPVTCLGGRGSISFRMYPNGLGEVFEGWSKNFSSGAVSIGLFILALIGAWITGCLSVGIDLFEALVTGRGLWAGSLFYLLFGLQIIWMLRRIGSFSWWLILLYPLALLFFLVTFVYSVISSIFLHKVTWKGRNIDPLS